MKLTQTIPTPNLALFLPSILFLEFLATCRQTARKLGWNRPEFLAKADLTPPDSEIAKRAERLLQQVSSDHLIYHSYRTYAFGAAIGKKLGRPFDNELLYLAALLHDLGFSETYQGPDPFEIRGAQAAYAWCLQNDLSEEKAELIHESIALHTSIGSAWKQAEIALIHFGAGADVIGYRIEEIAPETIEWIVAEWPRADFKHRFCNDLAKEVQEKPDSFSALQWKLGFRKRVESAPFAE